MKVYAMSISAQNINASFVHTVISAIDVKSYEEALGIGIEFARKRWKQEDGYYNYQCEALEIKQEWYNEPTTD